MRPSLATQLIMINYQMATFSAAASLMCEDTITNAIKWLTMLLQKKHERRKYPAISVIYTESFGVFLVEANPFGYFSKHTTVTM